jgi:hypothetical protein
MNSFIKYINEAKITERNDNIKNWKDIVNKFDIIEDAILQPNGKSIRVRGKKDGKFADVYTDYKNSEVAKEVLKKVQAFIGIKEAAVGQKGRTSYKEAMDYCEENEELVDEFRKIVKKLGGKTVAKALVDKLSQKPEIKDEMDHISNMVVDNTNY